MDKTNKGYHKLLLWQKLQDLVLFTYELMDNLPKSEEFGLKSQMKRAVVSVISNFVEGYLKSSKKEKLHYLEIAQTSLLELEAQSEICLILKFWTSKQYEDYDNKRREASYFLFRYKASIRLSV